jgi:catechol 2,3-dioxygenase-like lactoylglutathione lyase family enzyme
MQIWYRVSDLDAAQAFYGRLGFTETYRDKEGRWARLERDGVELSIGEEVPATDEEEEGALLSVDVADAKAEAERLRAEGVEVGVVVEIPGAIRLVDVFDPDGNRIQLSEPL